MNTEFKLRMHNSHNILTPKHDEPTDSDKDSSYVETHDSGKDDCDEYS